MKKQLFLPVILLCMTGCVAISSRPPQKTIDAKIHTWQQQKLDYNHRTPKIHFAAINITNFSWKYCHLKRWHHSSILITKILNNYFQLPNNKISTILNPNQKNLEQFFQELQHNLTRNETLILYLGTHHLNNDKILLYGKDESITAQQLFNYLKPIKQPILLFSDICHAEQLKNNAKIPTNITCIFACQANETTPDMPLDGSRIGPFHHFFIQQQLLQKELNIQKKENYSFAGYMFATTLLKMIENNSSLTNFKKLTLIYQKEHHNFRQKLPTYKTPHPVIIPNK